MAFPRAVPPPQRPALDMRRDSQEVRTAELIVQLAGICVSLTERIDRLEAAHAINPTAGDDERIR